MAEELFGSDVVITKSGTTTATEALQGVKFYCIYFSMHHCPPCREFTPIFVDLYNEINADEKVFEVIFVSGDKTQEEYDQYYAEMPWLALPRADKRIANIAKTFEVRGVPRLIVLKPDGTVINKSAVEKVSKEGPAAIDEFLEAASQ